MTNPFTAGFAKVEGGWTGTIAIAVGATTVTLTPSGLTGSGRASPASVLAKLMERVRDGIGGTWSVFPDTSGRINIQSSNAFSLAATNNTATRTGFGAATSAAYTLQASAHPNGVYPLSLSFFALDSARNKGGLGINGTGVTPTIAVSSQQTATIFETWENAHTYSAALFAEGGLNCYDIWISNHVLGRYKVIGTNMSPPGQTPSHWKVSVSLQGSE